MGRTECIYRIARIQHRCGVVSRQVFLGELEGPRATFKRYLEYMRDQLNAPTEWNAFASGYRLAEIAGRKGYALPRVRFSSSDIVSLLSLRELLNSLNLGLLTAQINSVLDKLRSMMRAKESSADAFDQRILILQPNAHPYLAEHFPSVATALMQRCRMLIEHRRKVRGTVSRREISPLRLTHYRENWYVDAYYHLSDDIRCSSLGSVQSVQNLEVEALEIDDAESSSALDSEYGIFADREVYWAELVFSAPC